MAPDLPLNVPGPIDQVLDRFEIFRLEHKRPPTGEANLAHDRHPETISSLSPWSLQIPLRASECEQQLKLAIEQNWNAESNLTEPLA